jgi:hypothetical protein
VQISDNRLTAYVVAASTLPASTLETITRLCEAKAQHSDDGAHAVVGAVLAVAAGTPITAAVRQNLRRAEVDRIREWQQMAKSQTALEALEGEALERVTEDRTGDDETTERRETFATALGALGNGDRAILSAVTGDAVVRYGTKVDTTRDDAGVAGKSGRLPLRVSVVAAATGIPAKGNGEALRAAACLAFARLSVTLRPPTGDVLEAVQARAEHSVRYVTRDTRAWNGNGQAVWQQDARPTGMAAATYSRTPVFPTDPAMRGAASSLPGVIPGTEGAVIRGAVVVPTYAPGTVWGAGPAVPLVVTDHLHAVAARRGTQRASGNGWQDESRVVVVDREDNGQRVPGTGQTRNDVARDAIEDRVSDRPCQRPREDGIGDSWVWVCGCGARPAGTRLEIRDYVREVSPYSTAVRNGTAVAKGGDKWVVATPEGFHPAIPCPAPREGRGGVIRCGCGRKRGALVNGCHR